MLFCQSFMSIIYVCVSTENNAYRERKLFHHRSETAAILDGRLINQFLPIKVKEMLNKLKEDGFQRDCDIFMEDTACVRHMFGVP